MSDAPICPCDVFVHPTVPHNLAGLDNLTYRVGDYTAFRHALLRSLPGEIELVDWRPSARGDLALQMMEWWAYLADILTFYNERIANDSYLRTADLPEDVRRLIRLLGYRPRPGIGAHGWVAALSNSPGSLSLPRGFPIGSKPGPGKQPQTFELNQDITLTTLGAVAVDPVPPAANKTPLVSGGVLVEGTVSTVRPGDRVLLLERGWNATNSNYALATVQSLAPEQDARGNRNTRVMLENLSKQLPGALARDYRLLYSTAFARVWQYPANNVIVGGIPTLVDLESLSRDIKVGDPVLFELPDNATITKLTSVTSYTEAIWFAYPKNPSAPNTPPDDPKVPAVPIPHTRIGVSPAFSATDITLNDQANRLRLLLRFGWQEVGQVLDTPVTGLATDLTPLVAESSAALPWISDAPLLIEDANGAGVRATGSTVDSRLSLTGLPDPPVALTPPLRTLFDLLPVSRGKTVPREVLGSGDAAIAGQEFVLQKSPLTYLQSGDSASGEGYRSTLSIRVDGIEWHEAASFYGQPPDARIFVTREDDRARTHVLFGDGVNGARLPTGANNVVASYRHGSGGEAPAAGSLTVILEPRPNLKAIRNPVAVGGGADPDPPDKIRRYAPRSVLTFGRAVSGDDYEALAAGAPGVTRARVYWAWNAQEQRSMVTVYVGDDQAAVDSATFALSRAHDPNRPLVVLPATAVPVFLSLTLLTDPDRDREDVRAAATAALQDPDNGLFSAGTLRIGQPVYRSQLEAALLVRGAVAVHGLNVWTERNGRWPETSFRYLPGEGRFFKLDAENLLIMTGVAGNG